jgi:hypothetical protein
MEVNLTEEERVDAFTHALGIAIRNIVDGADDTSSSIPNDLPIPLPKSDQNKGDDKHDAY